MRIVFHIKKELLLSLRHASRDCTKIFSRSFIWLEAFPELEFAVFATSNMTTLSCTYQSEDIPHTIGMLNTYLAMMYKFAPASSYYDHIDTAPYLFAVDNKVVFYFDPNTIEMDDVFKRWCADARSFDYTYAYSDDSRAYKAGEWAGSALWRKADEIGIKKCQLYYNWILKRSDGKPEFTNFGKRVDGSYGDKLEAFKMFGLITQ